MRSRSSGGRRYSVWALVAAAVLATGATACQPIVTAIPTPKLAKASCASGSSITVGATIVADLRELIAAAKADKVTLCGGGYRDSKSQIAVRKANCGPTNYDIYEKPASQCTPPTAIPGTSMHEKGLAIDFTNCETRKTACYLWLAKNADDFGFENLPSEPWHWSTNGH